ncbi:MAG: hypothetical protein NTU81_01525 [Candidatus Nomurabacteria bacterium]|nr:hypothetical protein [Candidatus Nomurabacteria bacterium]
MGKSEDLPEGTNENSSEITVGYFWEVSKDRDGKKSYFKNLGIFQQSELLSNLDTSINPLLALNFYSSGDLFILSNSANLFFRSSFN